MPWGVPPVGGSYRGGAPKKTILRFWAWEPGPPVGDSWNFS